MAVGVRVMVGVRVIVGVWAGVGVPDEVEVGLGAGVSVGIEVAVRVGEDFAVGDGTRLGLAVGPRSAGAPPASPTRNPSAPPAAKEPKAIQRGTQRRMGLIFARHRQPGNSHFERATGTT